MNRKMEDALNEQINAEMYSAYLYLAMEAYFGSLNLSGFANWMRIQAQEEMVHAMKFYDFIIQRDGAVTLKNIAAPPREWKSPLEVFEAVYKHEQLVTGRINALVNLAAEERDHATASFLRWYVDEQVEEEASAAAVVQKLKMTENMPGGLFLMDQEFGGRVFKPAPTKGE